MQRVIHPENGAESGPVSRSIELPQLSDCYALLHRIAGGKTFHRSPRLRDLLIDIGEHTLAGRPEELSEHSIGVRVFDREPGYNAGEDNIVRASVRQVRLKLKECFETEAIAEPLVLEIPKGSYVALFTPRLSPVPADLPEPPSVPSRSRVSWILGAMAAAVLIAGAIWLMASAPAIRLSSEPRTIFTNLLAQNSDTVNFVLTDSTLVTMNHVTGTEPSIEDYSSGKYLEKSAEGLNPQMRQLWQFFGSRQITSLADVLILSRLYQENPAAARRIEVHYARHMQTRDFKSGNFIITGSSVANPWTDLFEAPLNFQLDFAALRVHNRAPANGEPRVFEASSSGPDFARVALLRNLNGNGFVLLIAGLQAEGTEGAGEFLLRSDSLQQMRKALGLGPRDPIPQCEFVLEISTLQGTARSAKIVAWRRH